MNIAITHAGSMIDRLFGLVARACRLGQITEGASGASLHSNRLEQAEILALALPVGSEVVCLQGSVWITHDGDPKDVVLDAGQRHAVDRATRMLLQATSQPGATISIRPAA